METKTHKFHSDFALRNRSEGKVEGKAEGKVEGKVEGKAEAVLSVLAARGFTVPEQTQEHIRSCADPELLDTWVRRAVTADTLDDLFPGECSDAENTGSA